MATTNEVQAPGYSGGGSNTEQEKHLNDVEKGEKEAYGPASGDGSKGEPKLPHDGKDPS